MHMTTAQPVTRAGRIRSLDAVRGVAALAVVLNHWKHFDNNLPPVTEVIREGSPFYSLGLPFYEYGWVAVDFFFCMSGFIFAYFFAETIRSRSISGYDFLVRRVSRLYPLFLVTTSIVATAQFYSLSRFGHGIVYQNTDLYHLVLSLLFASGWGFEAGPSFNGPSWSISVEMLLYAAFFMVALIHKSRSMRVVMIFTAIALGVVTQLTFSSYVGRGLISFFLGWLVVEVLDDCPRFPTTCLVALLVAMWALTFAEAYTGALSSLIGEVSKHFVGAEMSSSLAQIGVRFLMIFALFPLTILALVTLEARGALNWVERFDFLGDLSYPVYLIHFPLQCAAILWARNHEWPAGYANTPVFMAGFFFMLLGLSALSAYKFEKPVQFWMRNALSRSSGR